MNTYIAWPSPTFDRDVERLDDLLTRELRAIDHDSVLAFGKSLPDDLRDIFDDVVERAAKRRMGLDDLADETAEDRAANAIRALRAVSRRDMAQLDADIQSTLIGVIEVARLEAYTIKNEQFREASGL